MTPTGAFCPHCHAAMSGKDSYCGNCGRPVVQAAAQNSSPSPGMTEKVQPFKTTDAACKVKNYKMLPIARALLRIIAVLDWITGVIFIFTSLEIAVGSNLRYGLNPLAGVPLRVELFILLGIFISGTLIWATADLMDIALRLNRTMPANE